MLALNFNIEKDAPFHLLLLGAHSDDIEIGCGGTILRLASEFPELKVTWVVFSNKNERKKESEKSANLFLGNVKNPNMILRDFRDGFFPYNGTEIKEFFEELKQQIDPDLIFTHHKQDAHQDHRVISELTWNTWRDHLILEYEIPKYDGDLGQPGLFVPLEHDIVARKIEHLLTHFKTQTGKHWFTEDAFRALLRIRGLESGGSTDYAEAFYSRKLRLC